MSMHLEQSRASIAEATDAKKKSHLGQFFTHPRIAHFMASLFEPRSGHSHRLLDAGAGIGALSSAFLNRWRANTNVKGHLELDAFEIDTTLHPILEAALQEARHELDVVISVRPEDFIKTASDALGGDLFSPALPKYTHAILNPPYRKIRSDSEHRSMLRKAGIETVNLYSAFVALSLALLEDGGQLVAIIPRSFCNGPYYRPFRHHILTRSAIRRIHLFKSRDKAFKNDAVLQENVIIHLVRGARQGHVTISTSTDGEFTDLTAYESDFSRIVYPADREQFIHVPILGDEAAFETGPAVRYSLSDIGISISTGPVVDFRLREHLRSSPEQGTVPLLYPAHFVNGATVWPRNDTKKPNAILCNDETKKWLYPAGHYCVVRRLSSKEEKRRIVANFVEPEAFNQANLLAFENHLNVFHDHRHGLPRALARGLCVFLNSTFADQAFRRFNGHTQVNASDLKRLPYPSRQELVELGQWADCTDKLEQLVIDQRIEALSR